MNANIKIVLTNKVSADGKYSMYLRITKDRKKKEINIGIRCEREHFEQEQLTKEHPNYKVDNKLIIKLKSRALDVIRDFQLNGNNFTLDEFENAFRGQKTIVETDAIKFFDEIFEEQVSAGRVGNAKVYRETKNALVRFAGNKILFREINTAFLEKFEVYMRSRGNEDGGIAVKMRQLRALFNIAMRRKLVKLEFYPFEDYKISKLKPIKNKRALGVEDFKKIRDLDLTDNPYLIEAQHYFIFSFYARGMNFVDIMKLKWTDIQDNRIYYTRSKTKGKFNIEVTLKMQKILDYYKAQNRSTEYVFPILLKDDLTPKQIDYRKHQVLGRCNSKLKQIAKLAKVDKHLTTYVARHSFATILKQIGTSTDIISELMGHADVQITMTYLKEFDNDVLDKANRRLLEL
ncbi:site-specific integrase [Dysgonomonas sp. GY617]|uniref:site-specific integrase n=1 Tax=Dysgonomonas sp. GY617 TaxID=2780420 RepID=UPI001883F069|nr:site-specific integrase [Dysgonomonas sp. GY617]MBF0576382.1 site-specific integrase [Dysgonomonas sp. GY617]